MLSYIFSLKVQLHCAVCSATCLATVQRNGKSVEIVAESRTATVSATCLARFSAAVVYVTLGNVSCNLSGKGVARKLLSVTAP